MKITGHKLYRHKDNPEEERFHNAFAKFDLRTASSIALPIKVDGLNSTRLLTPDEHRVAISTIQWLGSPVGINFLRDLGYVKVAGRMTDKDRRSIVFSCSKMTDDWSSLDKYEIDVLLQKECEKRGYTLIEFFAAKDSLINELLK